MVQKYQNEIAPIFYYGISTKTNEKDLKILDLQALTFGRVKKMTLYISILHTRARNVPSRRFKFHNHGEGPNLGFLLVESTFTFTLC